MKESFRLNLRLMRVFGLYPPNRKGHLYGLYATFMYFLFILPIPLFGCMYLLTEEKIDLMKVTENAFLLTEMGCYIIKFLPFIINGNRIKENIMYFQSAEFLVISDAQMKILGKCKQICRRNTNIFLVSVFGGVTSWAIKPLFLTNYTLPVDVWLPFDATSTMKIYATTYIYLVAAVVYAAFSSGVIDPLIAGLACEATGQLKILKHNLEHLSSTKAEDIYQEIMKCVKHHEAILDFVKKYEQCFSLVVFSQFVGSVFVICISCLQLSMIDPLSFNFVAMLTYLITMLGEIYLYCYYGATLYQESRTLSDAVYMSPWYEYDIRIRKILIIIMERSKKPITVRAGKILDLSLVMFTTILRRSYSLMAVLKNYK